MNAPQTPFVSWPSAFDTRLRERAHQLALERGIKLIEAFEACSGEPPETFTRALACTLNMNALSMDDLHRCRPRFDVLPYPEAARRECVLIASGEARPTLVLSDPFDSEVRAFVEELAGEPLECAIAHRTDVVAYLNRHEDDMRAMDTILAPDIDGNHRTSALEDLSIRSISDDASPVVKLVNSTLYDALKLGASDVHLETSPEAMHIKYRLDGVLSSAGTAPGSEFADQVISRIKVMAELDIAERRVPQDGRFKVAARGREIDVRVSVMPSVFGEDAVLRILDKQALADEASGLRLDSLGFDPSTLRQMRALAVQPYGMLLVTGPTGSGKTTTLYAALTEINRGVDKIITIEDPVEYQLPGILQIPVNEKKGLTFARGLRSILRHDPDKIMVGEIRDSETAQIAIQAALTGHLVFTTVHANNVFDVIGRFSHMAVDPHSFMSALNGIVAQRLMRINCPHCSVGADVSREQRVALGIPAEAKLLVGRGCGQCRGTGYRGRKAIAELLVIDDDLRELIVAREAPRKLKEAAVARGYQSLRQSAISLVATGESTIEELNRVTLAA